MEDLDRATLQNREAAARRKGSVVRKANLQQACSHPTALWSKVFLPRPEPVKISNLRI